MLYVARQFAAAVHLCACGCGEKVSTPLSDMEWKLLESNGSPSLFPSIGNWQSPCRSHYWIRNGRIVWAEAWTDAQIAAGQRSEMERRQAHFADRARSQAQANPIKRAWSWLLRVFWSSRP